jgi:hypothetical protein
LGIDLKGELHAFVQSRSHPDSRHTSRL